MNTNTNSATADASEKRSVTNKCTRAAWDNQPPCSSVTDQPAHLGSGGEGKARATQPIRPFATADSPTSQRPQTPVAACVAETHQAIKHLQPQAATGAEPAADSRKQHKACQCRASRTSAISPSQGIRLLFKLAPCCQNRQPTPRLRTTASAGSAMSPAWPLPRQDPAVRAVQPYRLQCCPGLEQGECTDQTRRRASNRSPADSPHPQPFPAATARGSLLQAPGHSTNRSSLQQQP